MAGEEPGGEGRDAAEDEPAEGEPAEEAKAGIAIPRIPDELAGEALAIAQQAALRTKQLVDLLHRARELGLPDPDALGFTGLDYDTLDAVAFGTLTWSGA